MKGEFQRLLMMAEPEVLPLNEQAARGMERAPERSQFSHLLQLFLERFFNHESASPDGDAKARVVLIALAAGIPGLMVAVYLWPVYHPFRGWPPVHPSNGGPPPYWLQVNHHFFFALYSFVVMGIATVFEWDLFFPDLLDVIVLKPLPVAEIRTFLARVAAIGVLLGGLLFDANFLAVLVLPAATDPPNIVRFLVGHVAAVSASGVFAATSILALEGALVAVLGERWFRRFSLLFQGLLLAALLIVLLLFPELSGVTPALLQSGGALARWFPPFWFVGIYQRLLEGPAALPVYRELARMGWTATLFSTALAMLVYPLAYVRRVRQLVEGAAVRSGRNRVKELLRRLQNATIARTPERRAIFQFIGQTVFRVPRYRIYLALYGGVGLSAVMATVLRFTEANRQVQVRLSADGIRASIGLVAFWVVVGLRAALVSPSQQQGRWVFRAVHGNPPQFRIAMEGIGAAKTWVLLWALIVTAGACMGLRAIAPHELRNWGSFFSLAVLGAGMCVVMTEILFLRVKTVPFAGEPPREEPNLAFTLLKYFSFFPLVPFLSVAAERWLEQNAWHTAMVLALVAGLRWTLRWRHRVVVKEQGMLPDAEDGRSELFTQLGLV